MNFQTKYVEDDRCFKFFMHHEWMNNPTNKPIN